MSEKVESNIFYIPTRSVKVFKNNCGNNFREYWYIHCQAPEIDIFHLDDEKGFTSLESITNYILKTISKECLKINKQVLAKLKDNK